ncbi:MAG: response regulator transcription factor [Armatimonadetes bacterium]|nr:response regulator transcription factor [Armatimonadota bacterium]
MRVLLADDHGLFRDGVASLLQAWNVEVVGQAGDGLEAVEQALLLRPDLVLMDIKMPRLGGLEATRRIKAALPATKIVMLTVSDDERDLFEAVKVGAEGYLLKNMGGAEFGEMLAGLAHGVPAVSRSLAGKLLREFARQVRGEPAPKAPDDLTEREKEVLQRVARGATNKQVAQQLGIAESTVNYHVKNILGRLHARNRAEAAVRALREGFVEPESSP